MRELFYRSAGNAAKVNNDLSRISINFIPMSLGLWALVGGVFLFGFFTLIGVRLDDDEVFALSDHPLHWLIGLGICLVAGWMLTCALYAAMHQNTVFRPEIGDLPNPGVHDPQIEPVFGVTGYFLLDNRHRQRFLNVNALYQHWQAGQCGFVSSIDASSRYMGITTQNRTGFWYLMLPYGMLQSMTSGWLYLDRAPIPALKVVAGGSSGVPRLEVVVTHPEPAALRWLELHLSQALGAPVRPV